MTVSSDRGTARQAACQRTATGPPRPPVFRGNDPAAARHPAASHLPHERYVPHQCQEFAHLRDGRHINVVDSGFVVDLGVYSAPNQPHSPDQPRYFMPRHTTGRLCITTNRSNCRRADGRRVGGFNAEDSGYTEDLESYRVPNPPRRPFSPRYFRNFDTAGAYGTLGAYGVIGAYERVSAGLGGVCPGRWRCVSWQVAVRADGWRCAGGWRCDGWDGDARGVCVEVRAGAGWWLGLVEVFGLDA
jgi:hypothetical protein